MPVRMRRNKRRRSPAISTEALSLFRQGLHARDPLKLRDIKIRLAAALGRSKFSASPLDREPRSLIGCDNEPIEVVLDIRTEMLRQMHTQRHFLF